MKKILSFLFTFWCVFVFVFSFLILYPFIYICIKVKKWHPYGHKLTRFWSFIFFYLTGIPISKNFKYKPDKNKAYVFVANHFSYLDVAAGMNIVYNYFTYVGKSSVKKVPLFGFMFTNLHIQVDRSDRKSRAETLQKGIDALKSGRSVFIMPEGGIKSKTIPKMHQPFKDGPFLMAIENQVPIVPISYLNFYDLNPSSLFKWGRPRAIINKPIETKGKTNEDIEALKKEVYQIIQADIDEWYGLPKTEYLA